MSFLGLSIFGNKQETQQNQGKFNKNYQVMVICQGFDQFHDKLDNGMLNYHSAYHYKCIKK